MDDDWMFGCQKPAPDPTPPPHNVNTLTVVPATALDTSLGALEQPATEGSSGQLQLADGQRLASSRQSLASNWQTAACSGRASLGGGLTRQADHATLQADESTAERQPSGADGNKPWTMSMPALRSSISFANALPPIPGEPSHQQQQVVAQKQQPTPALANCLDIHAQPHEISRQLNNTPGVGSVSAGHQARQHVGTPVSEWLSQQVSGELQTGLHSDGRTGPAEVATAEGEQGEASSSTSSSSDEGSGQKQVWHSLTDSVSFWVVMFVCKLTSPIKQCQKPLNRLSLLLLPF